MPKLNYPQYSGVTPAITTTGHKLSNSPSHCGSYGKRLHSNSHTKFTSPVATPSSTPAAAKPPIGGPTGGNHPTVRGVGGGGHKS
jgi:hypothetical protein